MKKLRIALILLLAMLVSVALFACGGKKDPKPEPGGDEKTIRTVRLEQNSKEVKSLDFTDVDGETQWQTALGKIDVKVVYREGGTAKLSVGDCTVSGTVEWGTVGNYSVTITPKENNANHYSASLEVTIEHDFHPSEKDPAMEICSKDKATRIKKDLEVELNWKGFHVAENYKFEKEDATGSIVPFGNIQTSAGSERVRTTTVGRLEKGMTITVTGTAQNANNLDYTYYFPILGFADTANKGEFNGYEGATGIFVRNEGWVLLNGVGSPRLLAGLVGGPTEGSNYGSHPKDEGAKPEGYVSDTNGYGPSNVEDWVPWHVYSHGTQTLSEDYVEVQNVKFSWAYHDIKEQEGYGFIVLTYYMLNKEGGIVSSLVSTCKVPDSDNGYYDSILHGEFVNMTFSQIETIQTRTLIDITYNGLKDGAKAHYIENEYLDFSTIDVTAEYEQNPGVQEPDTMFDVQAKVDGNWISLRYVPLSAAMEEFRIVRTVGGTKIEKPITPVPFEIHRNAVDVVYGYEIDGYKTNGTIGQIPVETVTDAKGTYVSLVLPATVAASSHGTDSKFVSLRLYARDKATGATQFTPGNVPTVKAGETTLTANTDYIITFADDGAYVDVIVFVKGTGVQADAILTKGVTISGLVEGDAVDVKVDLSAINGTESVSEILKVDGKDPVVYLEKGGEVTIKYHIADAYWIEDSLRFAQIYINGANARLGSDFLDEGFTDTIGGVSVSATANGTDHTITVVYNIPKFTVTNVVSYKIQLDMRNAVPETITQAIDTIYYDFTAHDDSTIGVWDNDNQVYLEANGTKLYLVQAFENSKLSESLIRSDSLKFSINTGDKDTINYLDLSYSYKNGEFVFANSTVSGIATGKLTAFGTLGNDYDYDHGAIAVIEVDLSKLPSLGLNPENAYYFELNGNPTPTYIYKVENNVLSKVENPALGETENLTADGTCLSTGYSGKPYQVGETTVFYATVTPSRGNHEIKDGYCTVCGATVTEATAPTHWFGGQYTYSKMLAKNSFLEFYGTFSEDETEALGTSQDTYYGYSIVVVAPDDVNYVIGGDGLYQKRYGGNGWENAANPYADTTGWEDPTTWDNTNTADNMGSSLITEEHPNNTINGWLDPSGTPIDAESYNKGRVGGTYRYTLTRGNDNVLSVRVRIWKQGVDIITGAAFVDFTCTLQLTVYKSILFMGIADNKYFSNSTLTVISGGMNNLDHEHAWNNTDHCTECGMLNPAHNHTWNHETCTGCLEVCTHENVVDNVCQKCHGVWTVEKHAVTDKLWDNTDEDTSNDYEVWKTWYIAGTDGTADHAATVSFGEAITVSGTQKGDVTENWLALLWEIKQGFTGRMDAYGWNFNNSDMTYTASTHITDSDGEARVFGWPTFKGIARDCNYTITFSWLSKDHLDVKVELTGSATNENYKGYTYTCDYVVSFAKSNPDKYTIGLTAEGVNSWSVTEYTHGVWTWAGDEGQTPITPEE